MKFVESVKENVGKMANKVSQGAKGAYRVASSGVSKTREAYKKAKPYVEESIAKTKKGAKQAREAYVKAKPYLKEATRRGVNAGITAINTTEKVRVAAINTQRVATRVNETIINKNKLYKLTNRGIKANEDGIFDDERGGILSFINDKQSATLKEIANDLELTTKEAERIVTRLLRSGYLKSTNVFNSKMSLKETSLLPKWEKPLKKL